MFSVKTFTRAKINLAFRGKCPYIVNMITKGKTLLRKEFESFSDAIDRLLSKWTAERIASDKFKHLRSKNHRPNLKKIRGIKNHD